MLPQIKDRKILFCVLNWGLGHATRSVPVINHLLSLNNQLILASSGEAGNYLKNKFPNLQFLEVPDYNIIYPKKIPLELGLIWQYPKVINAIKKEKKVVSNFIKNERINLLISDSRFGCYSKKIESILITHQLNIQGPVFLKELANYQNKNWLSNFNMVWVPDYPNRKLTGELSESNNILLPLKYIGPLSRLQPINIELEETIENLVILSGPEPNRSWFAQDLIEKLPKETVFIGKTQEHKFQFVDDEKLVRLIKSAKKIHCRSGYSTIMDLEVLGAIGKTKFYPTHGQSEQMYLATLLQR